MVHVCMAGVQPIAAAAMIDFAKTHHDRSRCFGFIAVGMCLGLVVYPMITRLFSDQDLLGGRASSHFPFLIGVLLFFVDLMLVSFGF